jgi:hypothetical protein
MKWLRTMVLFDQGNVISSSDWKHLHESYVRAIASIEHPKGSGSLTLRRKVRLPNKQWRRNGVGYLRKEFLAYMCDHEGWEAETDVELSKDREQPPLLLYPSMEEYREPITSNFGEFDFMAVAENGARIAIEWETGNISSSHRSMNKLAIALSNKLMDVGVLIVPSRALEHLTDRIGNIGELSGYLAMWEGLKSVVEHGLLAITVVEHDHLTDSDEVGYLKVGSDGRAREGRSKLK